ncbi:Mediator of DNA damage checkpoint protein 1 [Nymphon striatum]|nr:Mediator of DNA damage checkpoint protein 1 [Nymphon striatum]
MLAPTQPYYSEYSTPDDEKSKKFQMLHGKNSVKSKQRIPSIKPSDLNMSSEESEQAIPRKRTKLSSKNCVGGKYFQNLNTNKTVEGEEVVNLLNSQDEPQTKNFRKPSKRKTKTDLRLKRSEAKIDSSPESSLVSMIDNENDQTLELISESIKYKISIAALKSRKKILISPQPDHETSNDLMTSSTEDPSNCPHSYRHKVQKEEEEQSKDFLDVIPCSSTRSTSRRQRKNVSKKGENKKLTDNSYQTIKKRGKPTCSNSDPNQDILLESAKSDSRLKRIKVKSDTSSESSLVEMTDNKNDQTKELISESINYTIIKNDKGIAALKKDPSNFPHSYRHKVQKEEEEESKDFLDVSPCSSTRSTSRRQRKNVSKKGENKKLADNSYQTIKKRGKPTCSNVDPNQDILSESKELNNEHENFRKPSKRKAKSDLRLKISKVKSDASSESSLVKMTDNKNDQTKELIPESIPYTIIKNDKSIAALKSSKKISKSLQPEHESSNDLMNVNTEDGSNFSYSYRHKVPALKTCVMFTGGTNTPVNLDIVSDLGGKIVESVTDGTVLVSDKFKRTVKTLCCIALGKPIVTSDWLNNSKATKSFSDIYKYLLKDNTAEQQYAFNLQSTLELAKKKPLLTGFKIHVTGGVKPPPTEMKDIIQCAGAKFLAKCPNKDTNSNIIIISCAEDMKKLGSSAIPVVTNEFLLTGLLHYDFNHSPYLISKAVKDATVEPTKSRNQRTSRKV